MATKLKTPPFRASYPNLVKGKENKQGNTVYSIVALFRKGENLKELEDAIQAEAKAEWGDKVPREIIKKALAKQSGYPFRDQEEKDDLKGYEAGALWVNMTSNKRPGVVERVKGSKPLPIDDVESELYAGCWCKATVTVKAYEVDGNKGVSIYVNNIMKLKDDERLDSQVDAEDEEWGEDDDDFFDDGGDGLDDDLD